MTTVTRVYVVACRHNNHPCLPARSCIVDTGTGGGEEVVCAGYVREVTAGEETTKYYYSVYLHNNLMAGFKFVADGGAPAVWRLDTSGNIITERILTVEGI